MEHFIRNITMVLCSLWLGTGIAMSQDTLHVSKTDTINIKSDNASSFQWFVDSVEVAGNTSPSFYNNWTDTGYYLVSIIPHGISCIGNSSSVWLHVKDDVTIGGPQVTFVDDTVEICAITNVKPLDPEVYINTIPNLELENVGTDYAIFYTLDNKEYRVKLNAKHKYITINYYDLNLAFGIHKLRITRLMYGPGYSNSIKYSNSLKAPVKYLNVKKKPSMSDIQFKQ